MSVIENFSALSTQEQSEFAATLLNKINSENIFTADTNLEIASVEAYDLTGGLVILLSHPDSIEVSRKATWTCGDAEEACSDPGYEVEYENSIFKDAKEAFKTLSTVIDGYYISLEINDVDEVETVEVDVDHLSRENAGIGHYEYFGHTGHDSQPYIEVEGTIVKACNMTLAIYVEAADTVSEEN